MIAFAVFLEQELLNIDAVTAANMLNDQLDTVVSPVQTGNMQWSASKLVHFGHISSSLLNSKQQTHYSQYKVALRAIEHETKYL
jgi:hypothetical protein